MSAPLLSVEQLGKRFTVPVLKDINFELLPGEVHALSGANGAGKSTLCNIVSGRLDPSTGTMSLGGEPYAPGSVKDSEAAGVQMVMQELNLIDNLSVAENVFLGKLPQRLGFVRRERLLAEAKAVLSAVGLRDIDPGRKAATLGIGQKQLVEIARALINPARLIILDEPTAALTDPQVELLFDNIRRQREAGVAIIYVSHRLDEISRIADRITILRDGEIIKTSALSDISKKEIIHCIAGSAPQDASRLSQAAGPIALRVSGLNIHNVLEDINLDIHKGEILGIAGLIGSGRTELLRAIYGADEVHGGTLLLGPDLKKVTISSPARAVALGIGLIPEDRKQQGLLLGQSVERNVTLASLNLYRDRFGWIDRLKERGAVQEHVQALELKCTSPEQAIDELSGGNQQKALVARWLMKDCDILLFDEPTRGIDIQTKAMIYRLLYDLATQGKAVVVVSSETDELTTIADRIAVMSRGGLAAIFGRGEWTAEKIMAAAFSGYDDEARSAYGS